MRRWFRVIDTSRHCGLPVALACFILCAITGACDVFVMLFLPEVANYIMMGVAGGIGVVGLLSVMTGLRFFTVIYLIFQTLMIVPVCVCIYYITYTLCDYRDYYWWPYNNYNSYQRWLNDQSLGLLWTGEIVAFIGCILSGATLAGFRKLRLHQAGIGEVTQIGGRGGRRHSHCHTEVVVAQAPTTTVYTVPTTTYIQQQPQVVQVPYPQNTVYMQPQVAYGQQTPMYPNLPQAPPTYGAPPVNYNQQNPPTQPMYDNPAYNNEYKQ